MQSINRNGQGASYGNRNGTPWDSSQVLRSEPPVQQGCMRIDRVSCLWGCRYKSPRASSRGACDLVGFLVYGVVDKNPSERAAGVHVTW